MKLLAPAKVNLQLRVLGRRPDGFHEIETAIVPLSLADEITVELSEGDGVTISCEEPGVPTDRRKPGGGGGPCVSRSDRPGIRREHLPPQGDPCGGRVGWREQ